MPAGERRYGPEDANWRTLWTWVNKNGERRIPIFVVIILNIVVVGVPGIITLVILMSAPPADQHLWDAATDMYPDAELVCHAVLVSNIKDITGVLYGSEQDVYGSTTRLSQEMAEELAIDMVLDPDRRPPECMTMWPRPTAP